MKIYGITHCDTMRKTMAWLAANGFAFEFVDYRNPGIVADRLPHWLKAAGWETLLNRRGLTWKKLTEAERTGVDAAKARALMAEHPVLIRRPIVECGDAVLVGFDEASCARLLAGK